MARFYTMKKERFEDYLAEVEQVVAELEEGDVDLEKSLEKYEAGIQSLERCYEMLAGMGTKVESLIKDADGNFNTKRLT